MLFEQVRRIMRECPEFQDFGEVELGWMMATAKAVAFEDKDVIFKKGDPRTSSFFLVVDGQLEVLVAAAKDPEAPDAGVEAIVYPGQIVGEIGQVSPQGTRTRTVRSSGKAGALEWYFGAIKDKMPKAADKLAKRFEDLAFQRLSQQGMQ